MSLNGTTPQLIARELFKSSKDSASLESTMKKIFLVLGFSCFVSDIISEWVFGHLSYRKTKNYV